MQQRITLEQVPDYSFFVQRELDARCAQSPRSREELLSLYAQSIPDRQAMLSRVSECQDSVSLGRAMRRLRRDVLLALAIHDITGHAGYETVVSTMSALAEVCLSATVRVCSRELAQRFGVPCSEQGVAQDLLVLAMGKLGGAELNVSSDIDLVFLYDESGSTEASAEYPTARRFISNHEFFERLAKRVIPLLHETDADGFVFRVDMRLRPFGEGGPIVVSSEMLEEYLYTEGRDWERFAWLKARVVNVPVFSPPEVFQAASESVYRLVRPFVYRKYVDFGAINALSRVHEMIRSETARREQNQESGVNVKLGRGGIREIEFITQTFQVMRGGRETILQGRQTLSMLAREAEVGCLKTEDVSRLQHGYVFLRNLEHALQYVDDKQTHFLAADREVHERIAAMMGLTASQLREQLDDVREFVGTTFEAIFKTKDAASEREGWPVGWRLGDEAAERLLAEKLATLGLARASEHAHRVCHILTSRIAGRNPEGRDQFALFLMTLAENVSEWARDCGASEATDELFERYLALLEVVVGRSTYVTLLNKYPAAAQKVARILVASRWAAQFLSEHPVLLDELVDLRDERMGEFSEKDWNAWEETLSERLKACDGDVEQCLNILRDTTHSAIFRLLVCDLDGTLTVEHLADKLSAIADAVLRQVLECAWRQTPSRHRETPRIAVIGYGKLGGKELGYASDLDLVFLYEDEASEAASIYARLVRRMINWLTAQTSSGKLYEIDTRLRPEGEDGLLVCSLEHFLAYQNDASKSGAWVWEHQALTRARFCAGDPAIGRVFEEERAKILRQVRERQSVLPEVLSMRGKILAGHANSSGLFDVKWDRGGMVDVEFAVQTIVLLEASRYPELTQNLGNSALLEMSARFGLIEPEVAANAVKAYRHFRNIQRLTRLSLGENAPVRIAPERVQSEVQAVAALWQSVFGAGAAQAT